MRNIIFWTAIATGALMQVGVAAWANSHERALEGRAFTQIENVHPFQMMLNAKKLPDGEFEDFSLVFPSPTFRTTLHIPF